MEGTTINSMGNMGFTPQPTAPTPKGNKKKLIMAIIAALLIGGGIFLFVSNSNNAKKQETVEPTPTEEVLPTEEPTEAPDTSPSPTQKVTPTVIPTTGAINSAFDMNVEVLNGSGVPGAAASAAAFLREKGYKNVTAGNADNTDYTGVTVKVKASRSNFLNTLVNHLRERYTITASSSDLGDGATDAQVIIGR